MRRVAQPISGTVKTTTTRQTKSRGTSSLPRVADVLQQALAQEQHDLQFSDLTVLVERTEFQCHRLVLAAVSGFFRALLSSGMKEVTEKQVQLHDISCTTFSEIMKWIYDGDLNLTIENVFDLYPAADQLDIVPLQKECIELMTEKMSFKSCVRIFEMGCLYNCKDLKTKSWNYLLQNFDSVCTSEDLYKLRADVMMNLISDSNLISKSEDIIVETVLQWIGYEMTEQDHGVSSGALVKNNSVQCEDTTKDESSMASKQVFQSDEKAPGVIEIQSLSRKESLASVLGATRYLLVSSDCLWMTLMNDSRMKDDQRCRDILDDILHHKTQLDKHQNEWRSAETHRMSDKFRDVVIALFNGSLMCKLHWAGSWRKVYLSANLSLATHLAYYDSNIYFMNANTSLYVVMPEYDTSLCCRDNSSENIQVLAMFPIGDELISVRKCNDESIYTIESISLKYAKSSEWKPAGQLFANGMEVAGITNIGRKLVVFWKKGGLNYITIESFDLSQQKSFFLPDQPSAFDGLVIFKQNDQVFVLQQNGALWSVSAKDEAPYITMKMELWLWSFHRVINGAILVSDELWVFEQTCETDKKATVQTEEVIAKLDGVFKQVRFCYGISQTGFLHAVLPNDMIESV